MFTWRTTSTPATTAPNTTRVTIVPRAALTVAAVPPAPPPRKGTTMPDKNTITIDGIEYVRADTRPAISADIKIVRANRGYRDYIYVGPVTFHTSGDVRVDAPAACIRQYREKGLTGAASDPTLCTLDPLATSVTVRGDAVVDILDCTDAWKDAL